MTKIKGKFLINCDFKNVYLDNILLKLAGSCL